MNFRRVRAVLFKELREYRHNGNIVYAMTFVPVIFMINPMITIFHVSSSAAASLHRGHFLIYLMGIPALVPAILSSYSVVGERDQGTLEPVLSTPVRSEEFLLGKVLAALAPSLAISYFLYGLSVAVIELFARPVVVSAFVKAPDVVAQLVFTPLVAGFSVVVGTSISVRSRDVRVSGQFSALANIPLVAVAVLIAYNIIHPSTALALGLGVALLLVNRLGWRVMTSLFDRERLITGSRST